MKRIIIGRDWSLGYKCMLHKLVYILEKENDWGSFPLRFSNDFEREYTIMPIHAFKHINLRTAIAKHVVMIVLKQRIMWNA